MPVATTFPGIRESENASRPASHATALRRKSRFAFARRASAPLRANVASPTTTMRVGRNARSFATPPPRSSAAASTRGPLGSVVGSNAHGRTAGSDSPQLLASVRASGMNSVRSTAADCAASTAFVSAAAVGCSTAAPSKRSVQSASGRVTAWSPRSVTSTSAPLNVDDGDTAVQGSCRTPQSERSEPTPALGEEAVSTSRRPPPRRYPSTRCVSVRENGSRAPAITSTAQSSGTVAVCARSIDLMR